MSVKRVTVGNLELTKSTKGIKIELAVAEVQQLSFFTTKSGEERCNVVVDINDVINLLNEDQQFAGLSGFKEIVSNTKDLGPLKESATSEEVAGSEVEQYKEVHSEEDE